MESRLQAQDKDTRSRYTVQEPGQCILLEQHKCSTAAALVTGMAHMRQPPMSTWCACSFLSADVVITTSHEMHNHITRPVMVGPTGRKTTRPQVTAKYAHSTTSAAKAVADHCARNSEHSNHTLHRTASHDTQLHMGCSSAVAGGIITTSIAQVRYV